MQLLVEPADGTVEPCGALYVVAAPCGYRGGNYSRVYGGEGRRVETGPGGDESRVDMGVGDYGGTTQTEAAFPASHGDLTPTPQHQIPPVMLIMMDD